TMNRLSLVSPALLTRMSRRPSLVTAASTNLATCARSERSQEKTWARPPSSEASASSLAPSRPEMATVAPCPCSARAMLPPMPPLAPVTSAVLSLSSNIAVSWSAPTFYARLPSGLLRVAQRPGRSRDLLGRADRGGAERGHDAPGKPGQHLAGAELVDVRDP